MSERMPAWGPLRSVGELVAVRAGELGEREFLRFCDRVVSFAAAHRLSDHMGAVLRARGTGPGDRVAVMLPNVPWWPLTWFAIAKLGAVIVPVNVKYQREDLRHVLTDSGASLMVCGPGEAGLVVDLLGECPDLREVLVPEGDAPTPAVALGPDLTAAAAAAVVAVPDPARGEEVKAFLQFKREPVEPEAILDFARERLAAFKVPRYLEFVETFPFTPSERIAKHRLVHGLTWDTANRRWN